MEYLKQSFTVRAASRDSSDCKHGWMDKRGKCVFCGFDQGLLVEQMRHELTKSLRKVREDIHGPAEPLTAAEKNVTSPDNT